MKTILLSILFSFYFFANAQLKLQNIKYFSGYQFEPKAFLPLPNDEIMCIGYISNNGPFNFPVPVGSNDIDIFMMRLDKDYNVLWSKRFGGSNNDIVESAIRCKDGGYLITGETHSDDSLFAGHTIPPLPANKNLFVLKTDSLGNNIWVSTIAGQYSVNFFSYSVIEEANGGAFISGMTDTSGGDFGSLHFGAMYSYDWFLAKFDSLGNKLWVRIKGGSSGDMKSKIISDENGGMYFASYTGSADHDLSGNTIPFVIGPHAYIGHWDSAGNILWGRTCGGTGWNQFNNIYYDTQKQSVVVCGMSSSTDYDLLGHSNPTGDSDFWVMRFDTYGNLKWSKAWGGDEYDEAFTIEKNNQTNNYLVGGYSYSKNRDLDSLHIILNHDIDAWLISIDSNGNLNRKHQIGGNGGDGISFILNTTTNLVIVGGTGSHDDDFATHSNFTTDSYFIADLLDYPNSINEINFNGNEFTIYPNPVSQRLYVPKSDGINYKLISINGICMQLGTLNANQSIDVSNLSNGFYFLNLYNQKFYVTEKFLKL